MNALSAKDAKYDFDRLSNLACAESVAVAKNSWTVADMAGR